MPERIPFPSVERVPAGLRGRSAWPGRLVALGLVVPVAPVVFVFWLLVRLTSRGPGFYWQQRIGRCGRSYPMLKLRSMRRDAESETGAVWAARRDDRVTPVGRFLRWSHFDELPQLVNILRGEMAFVGPRPERPEFVDQLAADLPGYHQRLAVLPGVTGLAQVNLPPDESVETVRKKLLFDRYYIQHATPGMDLRILAATALRLLGVRYDRGAGWLAIDPGSLPGFPPLDPPAEAGPRRLAA